MKTLHRQLPAFIQADITLAEQNPRKTCSHKQCMLQQNRLNITASI